MMKISAKVANCPYLVFVLVDDEDYEEMVKYKWHIGSWEYAQRTQQKDEGAHSRCRKIIRMHRMLMKPKDEEKVDHINGDKLDNRRENLRICTDAQNILNRGKNRNNKSGFKGVSWKKDNKKWVAQTHREGKKVHIGYFKTKEDAYLAYIEKAKELHGEFFHP